MADVKQVKKMTAVSVSHVTLSVDITSFTENIMCGAIGTTGVRSKPSQLKIAELRKVATKSHIISKSDVRLLKGMEYMFPSSLEVTILQSLEQRRGVENFAACCKLSSTEIFAKELDVRTATASTNMMFITGILRQRQDVLVITMTGNQFGAQLPRGSKGTMIKNDAVTSMMMFKRANRTMRRERMSQNPWDLAFVQILDQRKCLKCRLPV